MLKKKGRLQNPNLYATAADTGCPADSPRDRLALDWRAALVGHHYPVKAASDSKHLLSVMVEKAERGGGAAPTQTGPLSCSHRL